MYLFLFGYFLGLFTVFAWYLQKSGKVNLTWYQWGLITVVLCILVYIFHRFFSFELGLTEQTFGYTIKVFILPVVVIFIAILLLPHWFKKKDK